VYALAILSLEPGQLTVGYVLAQILVPSLLEFHPDLSLRSTSSAFPTRDKYKYQSDRLTEVLRGADFDC
jgi:hypothetical protein